MHPQMTHPREFTEKKWIHFSLIIILFEKKNGASDQSGTICQNISNVHQVQKNPITLPMFLFKHDSLYIPESV